MSKLHTRSGRLRRSAACFLATLLAFAGFSFGQERIEKGTSLAVRIQSVKRVRVQTPQGESILLKPIILDDGIASRVRADGEELKGGYNEATLIPWDDVHEIRVKKSAALIGALAGLGLGGGFGTYLVAAITEGDGTVGEYFTGIAFFGVPSALLGALIGSAITHWKCVYVAPSGSRPSVQVSLAPLRRGGAAFSLAVSF